MFIMMTLYQLVLTNHRHKHHKNRNGGIWNNLDHRDSNGRTQLMRAAISGQRAVVASLMQRGANANLKDNAGRSALDHVSVTGDVHMVRTLAANGANVNIQEPNGWTPLMRATYRGFTEMTDVLLAHGADLNIRDNTGRTAESWGTGHPAVLNIIANYKNRQRW